MPSNNPNEIYKYFKNKLKFLSVIDEAILSNE